MKGAQIHELPKPRGEGAAGSSLDALGEHLHGLSTAGSLAEEGGWGFPVLAREIPFGVTGDTNQELLNTQKG